MDVEAIEDDALNDDDDQNEDGDEVERYKMPRYGLCGNQQRPDVAPRKFSDETNPSCFSASLEQASRR